MYMYMYIYFLLNVCDAKSTIEPRWIMLRFEVGVSAHSPTVLVL